MTKPDGVDWTAETVPSDAVNRAQKEIAHIARHSGLGNPRKTVESPLVVVGILKSLIEQCEKSRITHLPVASLKAALERWL